MARGDASQVELTPRPVAGLDMKTLPIGPEEAFILSRVDGRTSVNDIAIVTGFDKSKVQTVLSLLAELGAVAMDGADGAAASDPAAALDESQAPAGKLDHPAIESLFTADEPRRAPSGLYDPSELDETVDLSVERKRIVLDTYYLLESLDHYTLLRVPPTAEKSEIKSAYFKLVAIYHPDRYYGKNLGSFRPKLEKIFQQLTVAHDTLTRKKSRGEYDQYLESQRVTRAFDEIENEHLAQVEAIRKEIQREALMAEKGSASIVPPPQPAVSSEPSGGAAAPTASRGPSIPPRPLSEEERRRALARKFRGSAAAVRAQPGAPPDKEAVREQLKRRYEDRVDHVVAERVARYIAQADEAERAGNVVAAANALRIAKSLRPDDPDLAARLERVDGKASSVLHQRYLEQAQYEEQQGQFAEAARSYERAIRGKPESAALYDRAAFCYLEGQIDLKKASELARRAVDMAPSSTAYRITLARIYAQAGMTQSALSELERARTIDPTSDTIKDWIKRLRRGQG